MPELIAPKGFQKIKDDPEFNPAKHLALEAPEVVESLADFGYDADQIANCPSDFAASSFFRILSDEGAACLLHVCRQLSEFTTSNQRIERNTRGGVYRSSFLADLCRSEDVRAFCSDIAGIELLPHTIPHQLGHLNYNPHQVGKNVDKWHVDTLRYDYVMFVTDPKALSGGEFQYFRGTKDEFKQLKETSKPIPKEKIISPDMPGPGYAILQQGNMVVHQAKALKEAGERITMVNGYVANDARIDDYCRFDQLWLVDPQDVITSEYAHHAAATAKRLIDHSGSDADRHTHIKNLREAAQRLQDAASMIESVDTVQLEHFGD